MHAVVVTVTISDVEAAEKALREDARRQQVTQQAPGFVAGYWTRKDSSGLSMAIFESEDQAQAASERIPASVPEQVTLENVEVREVVAHARQHRCRRAPRAEARTRPGMRPSAS